MRYHLLLLLFLAAVQHTGLAQPVKSQRSKNDECDHQHISRFISKFRLRQQDVTIVMLDGSISTDMGYATKRPDQAYRPPCFTEFNIPSFIEEKLRWREQQFRRYDSKVTVSDSIAVFTETGRAVTQQFDSAWDWQNRPPVSNGYNGLTRILSGPGASVSYLLPTTARRCDFIYRTDYLSSSQLRVFITGSDTSVKVYDEVSSTWKQANGYTFSAQEKDETIPALFYPGKPFGATSLRKSVYQKRLKFRCPGRHDSLRVKISSPDSGRLCYWGITFSPKEHMIQFINSARGGHDIALLKHFEKWSVDYWKPDLILYSCNTINEGADVSSSGNPENNPEKFANRFGTFIRDLLQKPYQPEVFAWMLFTAEAHGLVNESDSIGKAHFKGYGEASVFDFIDSLNAQLRHLPIASANAFYYYWEKAVKKARKNNTTVHFQLFGKEGAKGCQYVGDGTHLNDYGAVTGWEYLSACFEF